jgi:8-oxo-dGTP diphosphatase
MGGIQNEERGAELERAAILYSVFFIPPSASNSASVRVTSVLYSSSLHPMLQFGTRDSSATYIVRPGAYAIMQDDRGRIGIVMTSTGAFLPGGGQDPGETLEEALHREMREECGLEVRVIERLGCVIQLVHSLREKAHFEKVCTFFRVVAVGTTDDAVEQDHELIWLEPAEAIDRLCHEGYRHALEQWARATS